MERSRSRLNALQQLKVRDREIERLVGILSNRDRSVDWAAVASFLHGWTNFGGGEEPAAFSRTSSGVVVLRGRIKSGTMATSAFVLPGGFRPSGTKTFAVESNNLFGALKVALNGDVIPSVGSNVSFSLEGVMFRAET